VVDCGALREVDMFQGIAKEDELRTRKPSRWLCCGGLAVLAMASCSLELNAQTAKSAAPTSRTAPASKAPARPKLVVLLVVDQMRGDYVDKFLGQWNGGLRRLVQEGAWFRDAAYPYAATETCVGHATISTGALPATHGMVANAWWDREAQKMVTCTSDPNAKNVGYAGAAVKGGDSAWRMEIPAFAEELKFQTSGATRVVTFSLKARAAITMAGHKGDAVTWADGGGWVTSSVYGTVPFVEAYAKEHPVKQDYGKTWTPSLPESAYWYDEKTLGAVAPEGWELTFPHPLRGKAAGNEPDAAFYEQWASSPYADTYLTHLAEAGVDALGLGKGRGIDFVGVSYSSVDYVGHAFGPRSREIQDVLIRLDKDLGELFAHLDQKVGRGNYVVAFSADHGVVPVPEDMQKTGADAGVLRLPELQDKMEKALEPFNLAKPAIARITGSDVYFAPDVYEKLKQDPKAMRAVTDAALAQPGVAEVFRAEQLQNRPATQSPTRRAMADSYFPGRSGDLFIVNKPYWLMDGTPAGKTRSYGTGHGTPYNYDQHVPVLFMGFGIQHGEYHAEATPADIAPTLASLCGITLAARDGRVLADAIAKH
jgi:predicted AlkP superfamily pyrophosphatase or phosphodiesterase